MDAVITCCDWDPDPPNVLESDIVTFFKLTLSRRDGGLGLEGWRSRWFIFFGQKCDEELVGGVGGQTGRQTGGRTFLHLQLWYFFSTYKLPKTVTVTILILFGHVTLLFGKFLFIKLSEGPVQLSTTQSTRPCSAPPAYPFPLVGLANNTTWYSLQRRISVRPKFHPSPDWNFHTEEEAENWHRIPTCKRQLLAFTF